MSFPLYSILFLYVLFLVVWLFFSMVGVYHMIKFGWKNFYTFIATFFYIAGSIILLVVSYNFIIQIDWGLNVSALQGIFDSVSF